MSDESACGSCGRTLAGHERNVRFTLPDPVLDVPEDERAERSWGNSDLLQVMGIGCFIRVVVPVTLAGGRVFTYAPWLSIAPDDLQLAFRSWSVDAYLDLRLEGVLANRLPPWGDETFGRWVATTVVDPDQVPLVVSSPDAGITRILEHPGWPHALVLDALPG